jgi:multicomponent Na+:H+ antiporter subunit B
MTRSARIGLFAVSAAGLAALLLWAVAGLPDFGHFAGRYGATLNKVAVSERHATNVVTAIVFDYRGFDTLGEEFILFTSVMGVATLLTIGFYIVAHGAITPGGGFQGGVILAGAFALVYLAGEYRAYRAVTPRTALDFAEGTGVGGYAVIGIVSMLLGSAYLHNFGPFGQAGTLASAGTISMLNLATALEVTAAFVLLFTEFLEELVVTRAETE